MNDNISNDELLQGNELILKIICDETGHIRLSNGMIYSINEGIYFHEGLDFLFYAIMRLPYVYNKMLNKGCKGILKDSLEKVEIVYNEKFSARIRTYISVGFNFYETDTTANYTLDLWRCLIQHIQFINRLESKIV